jgi:hypothetical protein
MRSDDDHIVFERGLALLLKAEIRQNAIVAWQIPRQRLDHIPLKPSLRTVSGWRMY